MNLQNKLAADLLKKDKKVSNDAAFRIVNEKNLDAWVCLVEEGEYVFDFIKRFASQKLLNACNHDNIYNLFDFMKYYSSDWDDFVAQALAEFCDDDIVERCLELLETGTKQEKAYCAKFFSYVQNEGAIATLFENSKSQYSPLASNCAIALGEAKDEKSYDYYLELLSSEDDWDKLQAAQFLSLYGNKEATSPILEAMSHSTMSEHIAGELASFRKLNELINSEDGKVKELSLECLDHLLSGLVEIWPLSVLFDFEIKACLDNILNLLRQEDGFTGRYSQILLKAQNSLNLFNDNSEYKYDEDKNTLDELANICDMLNSQSEDFWEVQIDNLLDEIDSANEKRQIAAISLIAALKVEEALPYLMKKLDLTNETILCEVIIAIGQLGGIKQIANQDAILDRMQNDTLKAIAQNIFLTAV